MFDVIMHEDVYPNCTPLVTTRLPSFMFEGSARSDPFSKLDHLDLLASVEFLGFDIGVSAPSSRGDMLT